ncbi:MAG: hypothetical protein AAFP10_01710 [Pseudomonadota bacterium]
MPTYRDTFKYQLKQGEKILHLGITNDLQRREYEYQQEHGDSVYLQQVGFRVSRQAGREWLSQNTAKAA